MGVTILKSRAENQGVPILGSIPGPTLLTIHAPKQKDLVTGVCWTLRNAAEQGLLHVFHFLCFELLQLPPWHRHDPYFYSCKTTMFHVNICPFRFITSALLKFTHI